MNYKGRLITGTIKALYKNLIIDVELDNGKIVQALNPEADFKNFVYAPGAAVWLTQSADKRRRVSYICQMVNRGEGMVFINYKYKK